MSFGSFLFAVSLIGKNGAVGIKQFPCQQVIFHLKTGHIVVNFKFPDNFEHDAFVRESIQGF